MYFFRFSDQATSRKRRRFREEAGAVEGGNSESNDDRDEDNGPPVPSPRPRAENAAPAPAARAGTSTPPAFPPAPQTPPMKRPRPVSVAVERPVSVVLPADPPAENGDSKPARPSRPPPPKKGAGPPKPPPPSARGGENGAAPAGRPALADKPQGTTATPPFARRPPPPPVGAMKTPSDHNTDSDAPAETPPTETPLTETPPTETPSTAAVSDSDSSDEDDLFVPAPEVKEAPVEAGSKRFMIVREIMMTETSYVESLEIVDVFFATISCQPKVVIPKEVLSQIFSNAKELLRFHTGVMRQLEEVVQNWNEETSTIGDVFSRLAPFLKVERTIIKKLKKGEKGVAKFVLTRLTFRPRCIPCTRPISGMPWICWKSGPRKVLRLLPCCRIAL